MVVSPEARLRYWRFNYWKVDPVLLKMALEHIASGAIVWDVGANVGLFSFAAGSLIGSSGRVLAIEADTWLVSLLRGTVRLRENKRLCVEVLPVAVSDSLGISTFNIARRSRASNFLEGLKGPETAGGIRETQLIATVTLDWLMEKYPAPGFLKIDAECAEGKILKGAEKLLSEIKPVILCEVTCQKEEVTQTLKRNGYTLFDAKLDADKRVPLDEAAYDTLAYPPGYRTPRKI